MHSTTAIYNADHDVQSTPVDPDRLEDAWFVHHITKFHPVLTWHRKRHEVDMEPIARDVYRTIADIIDTKWLNHTCEAVGCKDG